MRMKKLILLLFLLQQVAPAQAQDCTPRDFERLMAEAKRLAKAGFSVEVVSSKAYPQAKRSAHTIFVADRARPAHG